MTIKGCKTIAEYAFRRWMAEEGLISGYFTLTVMGNEGTIEDMTGEKLTLVYNSDNKSVYVKE